MLETLLRPLRIFRKRTSQEQPSHPSADSSVRGTDAEAAPSWMERCEQDFIRESSAFERLLPALLETRAGRFVALRHGRIIDEDADEFALARRIQSSHRKEFVLIRRVSREVIVDHLPSPLGDMP